jgi:hypothetical protein
LPGDLPGDLPGGGGRDDQTRGKKRKLEKKEKGEKTKK